MKYISMLILIFSISTLRIYADEIIIDGCTVYFNELSSEQKEEVIELREDLLVKSNEIKDQLKSIRYKIQQEMRKETPDWGYMDDLNKRFFALQGQLTNELLKYKSNHIVRQQNEVLFFQFFQSLTNRYRRKWSYKTTSTTRRNAVGIGPHHSSLSFQGE